jgi:transposase-like protein
MKKTNERKRRALELMTLGGMAPSDAARAVGVSAGTVNAWLRNDAAFRKGLEAWRAGPALDETTVAQARRIIVDELAKRVLHGRSKMSLRDLLTLQDRLTRKTKEKNDEDGDAESGAGDIELTPEQVERIWAEIDRGVEGADKGAPAHETKP